jgi:hypothetical protein
VARETELASLACIDAALPPSRPSSQIYGFHRMFIVIRPTKILHFNKRKHGVFR